MNNRHQGNIWFGFEKNGRQILSLSREDPVLMV